MGKPIVRSKHNLPINERLRMLRVNKKLRQIDVAKMLDTKVTTYAGYEARETADNHRYPQIHTLKLLAEIYDTTTDYLLGLTDIPEPPRAEQPDVLRLLSTQRAIVDGVNLSPDLSRHAIATMKQLVALQKSTSELSKAL